VNAVAGDEHIAPVRLDRLAVRIDEAGGDLVVALLDADAAMAGDEVLRTQALAHGVEQHLVQVAAVDGKVRPLVPGREPPGLAVDQLAMAGEEGVIGRLARDRRERVLQAERAQLLDGVGPEIDADPERQDLGRRLEHPDAGGDLRGMRGERQGQPADAATDDDEVQRVRSVRTSGDMAHSGWRAKPAGLAVAGCNIAGRSRTCINPVADR
jgi:hypothetical protein